jgi:type II secretory pathway pseudopilin PulG
VKRCFSLLEVLIAFLLISLSLPLLMAPFIYASVDQKEMVDKMRAQTAAQFALTSFLIDLQQGKIPITQIVDESEFPMKEEWFKEMGGQISGNYTLKRLKPARDHTKDDEDENVVMELWKVGFTFTSLTVKRTPYFPFLFVIVRGEAPVEKHGEAKS